MDKVINFACFCGTDLLWKRDEVIMLNPCEHLVHRSCFKYFKYLKSEESKCPMCLTTVKSITRAGDFRNDPSLYQKCVDILSVTNFDDKTGISYDNALFNLPRIAAFVMRIPFTRGINGGHVLCGDILRMGNIKIKVTGLDKIQKGPKVFIANHTCYIDFLALFYVLKTGFLSSSFIKKNPVTKQLLNILPILVVDNTKGAKTNTVEKMTKYVEDTGSICLFPEGMLSHPETLTRFRTGAFNIGYPVYPIVLKYKNNISDTSILDFVLKTGSSKCELIEFMILDPFYPPFDDNKIELVRHVMAEAGDLMIARTSNKYINDIKKK